MPLMRSWIKIVFSIDSMETNITLKNIFHGKVLRIPDYQRGYAWEIGQLRDFWKDLLNLGNRHHYTGLITIALVPEEKRRDLDNGAQFLIYEKTYTPYYVVDGQQRLTTITIFLQCLIDIARENEISELDDDLFNDKPLSDIGKEFICLPKDDITKGYKLGYSDKSSLERSAKFLESVYKGICQQEIPKDLRSLYTVNLRNAQEFFKSNLKEHIKDNDSNEQKKLLSGFYNKLTSQLKFNLYTPSDELDTHLAFETMNNRGKPLSALEILKNRLLYLTTLYDRDCSDSRDKINETWGEIYKWLGRKWKLDDDEFLRDHCLMFFGKKKKLKPLDFLLDEYFVSERALPKFKTKVDSLEKVVGVKEVDEEEGDEENDTAEDNSQKAPPDTDLKIDDINAYVTSLAEAAEHWYRINTSEDEEHIWFSRLRRSGYSYFRPLVLALCLHRDVEEEDKEGLLEQIEKFMFIAFKMAGKHKSYKRDKYWVHARELHKLYKNQDGIEKIKTRIMKAKNELMSDEWGAGAEDVKVRDVFRENIKKKEMHFFRWAGLKYFLEEYEKFLGKNKQLIPRKDRVESIEHIYPQTHISAWDKTFGELSKETRKHYRNSLGNLLLVLRKENIKMSNKSFSEKKKYYKDGTYSEREVAKRNVWGPKQVIERGLELLSFMEKRWNISLGKGKERTALLLLDEKG